YVENYCEENVYRLCERCISASSAAECYAVVVTNAARKVPIWCQRCAETREEHVLWDYHVILLVRNATESGSTLVFDLDSTLPFPCDAVTYIRESFRPHATLDGRLRQCFRVVAAAEFVQHFASDRSHMRDENSNWVSPPPPYSPIRGPKAGSAMNLDDWLAVPPQ
ncbi:unnamed protein product, partial [Phaeothamnion confervicola]